jgi:DNA-binding XRE family transcriptional regulator
MLKRHLIAERELAAFAKQFRIKSGMKKAQVARKLRAARPSVQQAEENPEQSLTKLRIRIIEACSTYRVRGPAFWLERK